MLRNQFQRMVFALLTVIVTVHAYVFYSLYVVNGNLLMNVTGSDFVLHAIDAQGRSLYVWTNAPDLGCDSGRILFCIRPGMCDGKSLLFSIGM